MLLLLASALPAFGPAGAETLPGPGDVRDGYERADYRTRSAALRPTATRRLDLAALAARPPLGLDPLTGDLDPAAVDLGRRLFFDRRLSANRTLSCGMCHIPEQAFTHNELATPVGLEGRAVRRNAPSLYNVAYLGELFHDGRGPDLEQQIWEPLLAVNEMGNRDREGVLGRLAALDDYAARFAAIYPAGLTAETLGNALASYQRGLLSAGSAFDRWYHGGQTAALTARERLGFAAFNRAGCIECHRLGDGATRFTDDAYYNTGIGYRRREQRRLPARLQLAPGVFTDLAVAVSVPLADDDGRAEVTGLTADRWRYRTPSLRNVALTAPYMHDGSLGSLSEVVDYYDAGGSPDPEQDPRIRPLGLSAEEKQALLAFLQALTGSNVAALAADARSASIGDPS